MSRPSAIRYTYQDYLGIPEDPSRRHEIVDGELHVSAAPRFRHQEVVGNLLHVLHDIVRSHDLSEVVPGPVTVHLRDELVVEILSPSNRAYDRDLKRKRYLENGVAEVWIADADERWVEVWRPGREEPIRPVEAVEWEVEGETFSLSLEEVFRGSGLEGGA